ncbi:F0F1 ATP synthase subunit epsilon [Lacinutrix neustonica]|uniref:F0F1 ATP synthase subunit epsilon n=1 Tax=Lacinutrix neustonica TaxID=2980107 RepID=A0A9E8SD43_9FLAO|nr:F0F1 ATP synthase subunit epsilon [Lacinutrix neustonica]WAC00844.1 F0F1 ATP synthase subunit epsilon [Lacinutrix neustonica]
MYLEIVSPEATLFANEVDSVTVPGVDGEFQLLNNHAAIVSLLKAGNIKIHGNVTLTEDVANKFITTGNTTSLAIQSGTLEMKDNKVIILAD